MSKRTIIIAAIAILALLAALFSAYSDKKTVTPEADTEEDNDLDDLDEEVENLTPEPEKKKDLTVSYEKPGTDTDTEKV